MKLGRAGLLLAITILELLFLANRKILVNSDIYAQAQRRHLAKNMPVARRRL